MKKIITLHLTFTLLVASWLFAEDYKNLDEFSEVSIESDKLVLVMKEEGVRFICTIGDESVVPETGETIFLPLDKQCYLSSRHYTISFTPLTDSDETGFSITKTIDARSFGGGKSSQVFKVLLENGNIVYTDP